MNVTDIYASGNVYNKGSVVDAIKSATGQSSQLQCSLYKQIPLCSHRFSCA